LSDGWKKEIYQYIRFFHGALHLLNFSDYYTNVSYHVVNYAEMFSFMNLCCVV